MVFKFQKATLSDRSYLLELRKSTMVKHLENSGQYLSEREHDIRLDDEYDCSHLAYFEGALIGTLKYKSTDTNIEIMQLQIAPEHQNKGFGKGIIEQIQDRAGTKSVSLTVLKDNPALKLYLRLGFKIVGEDFYEYHMVSKTKYQGKYKS
ncbi:GNAT family N-acetyltransferase [Parashewanella spongiae]|uniref:GNAT family N-acetyltransferase n=1 Tax=Parashewanella spongiae TaxID=342950 RepID=A0A3A6TU82_9GAMM|nr:GNAT family N-acetyltransferase [Parashewanella spongiae]MCL1076654.1 GNAT family N-acetyltransferase [Parashewanella spongiae]RJY12420.1 GNAT family N-acetyltransferase [Parashewanella spongiae]